MNAVLVIDKPAGWTSHDVVARVRSIVGERSVGHLGTLDPLATGVLPLVLGRWTRLAQFYTSAEKVYEGTIRLGQATDTFDAVGDPVGESTPVQVTRDDVERTAQRFVGEINQMPPPFSAKKIAGVPAYKLARKKQEVELKPVKVSVRELTITQFDGADIAFRARVSSGTYLRSIAHELGQALGCGGHLAALRRTGVAEFAAPDAHRLEDVEAAAQQGRLPEVLFHPRRLLQEMPAVTIGDMEAAKIRTGQAVNLPELSRARMVKVFRGQTELLAIVTRIAGTLFHPTVVLMDCN